MEQNRPEISRLTFSGKITHPGLNILVEVSKGEADLTLDEFATVSVGVFRRINNFLTSYSNFKEAKRDEERLESGLADEILSDTKNTKLTQE